MTKYRAYYAVVLAVALVLLLWFHNLTGIVLVLVVALLPLLMWIGLCLFVRGLRLSAEVSDACRTGEDIGLMLTAKQGGFRLLAGMLEVTVSFQNVMFDTVTVKKYRLPLGGADGAAQLPYTEEACGLVEIRFSAVCCTDLLGVTSKKLSAPAQLRLTVYPQMVAMNMLVEQQPHGVTGKERYDHTKKGTDVSEIFDLREYHAGDPMHLIHWKLSEKTDTMIVREPGNPSQYDTILYLDIGLFSNEDALSKTQISAAAAVGISVSETLLRSGIAHCVSMPWEKGISEMPVSDRTSYAHMQESMMGMRLQKHCGEQLPALLLQTPSHLYSKMICIVWGMCPPLLEQLTEEMDITVLLLYDGDKALETVVNERITVITISAKQLYEKSFVILI